MTKNQERRAKNATAAAETHARLVKEFDALLRRIQKANRSKPDANWGDVGTMTHRVRQLQELSDNIFQEGEYSL